MGGRRRHSIRKPASIRRPKLAHRTTDFTLQKAELARPRNATMSWLPLESNPDVLNPFIRRLGVPGDWEFTDVFGLDDELLAMVPPPCWVRVTVAVRKETGVTAGGRGAPPTPHRAAAA